MRGDIIFAQIKAPYSKSCTLQGASRVVTTKYITNVSQYKYIAKVERKSFRLAAMQHIIQND